MKSSLIPENVVTDEISELLSFDGIRLMDQQNLYVQEGIEKLAKQISDTVSRRRQRHQQPARCRGSE